MKRSTWIWIAVLVLVLALFLWWWFRRHKKAAGPTKPGIGTPLHSPAAAPPPTSIFSSVGQLGGIFSNFSSIFSKGSGSSSSSASSGDDDE